MKPFVILFDVDGVLVQPGGYRAAVRATVNFFTNQMGLGDLAPDDETVAIYESQGITCEWDMVPLTLAIVLEAAAAAYPGLPLDSFESTCQWLRRQAGGSPGSVRVHFPPALRELGRFVHPGTAPADSLLRACLDGQADGLFPRLAGAGVMGDLLSHTRHAGLSRTTPVFETFALGDQVYSRSLGLPAAFRSESLLARYDRPLLSAASRDRLNTLQQQGSLRLSAYTARPSRPVGSFDEPLAVFAPEAELALEQVGLRGIQLVGSGQVGEAARRLGENADRLTKPAPYHAIAAVAAAWTGDRQAALLWTEAVFCHFERGMTRPGLETGTGSLPERLTLHIFEDSPTGMAGGIEAARLFARLGMTVDLSLWGVTEHPEKAAALRQTGASVFPDVNQALSAAIGPG